MRSQDARILILEEEVKTSAAKETETIKARDQAVKEVQKINERFVLFNNMYEPDWYWFILPLQFYARSQPIIWELFSSFSLALKLTPCCSHLAVLWCYTWKV